MKTLESIFKIYNIEKALVKNGETIEIIFLKRKRNLNLSEWINFINNIKFAYGKDVDILMNDENLNFSEFILLGGNYEQ